MSSYVAAGSKPSNNTQNDLAGLATFVITLFVSAFLLFSVQPFFAKMVLPRLGGSPAVWSVAMVFFQAMLLAGYIYAHLLSRYLPLKWAAIVHLAVMLVAVYFLPVAIPDGWETPPQTGQQAWLLGLFAISVGLPFFAVAANGPLLQSWFSKSGHPHSSDPYFLYSASNLGSFASLFLFVATLEPNFTVTEISIGWMIGFIALGVLIAACAFFTNRIEMVPTVSATLAANEGNSALQILKWIGLSFVPSGLLVAVTAHISTDIAAAPFLWIVPLALFLLTFVFAFAQKRLISVQILSATTSILAVSILASMHLLQDLPMAVKLALHLLFFFSAALLCHSVLVDQRPASNQLTAFYLWMSFGGMLGGIFASLLAPVLFTRIVEYPILIVLALFCRPNSWRANNRKMMIAIVLAVVVALVLSSKYFAETVIFTYDESAAVGFAALALTSFVYMFRAQTFFLVQAIVMTGLMVGMISSVPVLSIKRSFFGVVKVLTSVEQKHIVMAHGSTVHGAMAVLPATGKPEPLTYYHRTGGIAGSLFAAQQKWALKPLGRNASVGVVGLGTGSILCHRKPNESWVSYEIDNAVIEAAADPKLFRFVSECGNNDPIIVGDARLKLLDEPDGKFDYLLIDAFSSDSIPVHLLTEEAVALYFSKLTEDGMLVVHISNRYMELASILQAIAEKNGYVGREGVFEPTEDLADNKVYKNRVVVLAKSEAALGQIIENSTWQPLPDIETKPWTDDYSNLLGALMRGYFK